MKSIAQYSYIMANLRAKISNILDLDYFLKCADVEDLETLLLQFKDTEFSFLQDLYHQTADLKSCEKKLKESEIAYNSYIYKKCTGSIQDFCKALAIEYEVELLKEVFRLWFDRVVRGENINEHTPYLNRKPILHHIPIDPILNAESFEAIVKILASTPYGTLLKPSIETVEESQTIYPAEILLDNFYFLTLRETAQKLEKEDRVVALDYISSLIDIENLNRIIRLDFYFNYTAVQVYKELLDGGKRLNLKNPLLLKEEKININAIFQSLFSSYLSSEEEATGLLEKLDLVERVDSKMREHQALKALMGDPFSVGIIIAFIIRKKIEIRRGITLINAKYYRLPYDRIKELL